MTTAADQPPDALNLLLLSAARWTRPDPGPVVIEP
jgi:hypothetical protein